MRIQSRPAALLLAAAAFVPLASCAGPSAQTRADTQYVARDVNTLYNLAKDRLDRNQYALAAAIFSEVERQHPYSPWARRAQLM
ncbi:MAG: outer membrane protein assembly factor BamD, partial [Parasphingopyxis sp.]